MTEKPRGPKKWGVEPDWSKLPSTPRRHVVPDDGPGWGASALDARDLIRDVPADDASAVSAASNSAPAWSTPDFQALAALPEDDLTPEPTEPTELTEPAEERTREPATEPAPTPSPSPMPASAPTPAAPATSPSPEDHTHLSPDPAPTVPEGPAVPEVIAAATEAATSDPSEPHWELSADWLPVAEAGVVPHDLDEPRFGEPGFVDLEEPPFDMEEPPEFIDYGPENSGFSESAGPARSAARYSRESHGSRSGARDSRGGARHSPGAPTRGAERPLTDAPQPPQGARAQRAPIDPAALRADAEAALRRLVGREDARLRDDQWRAIEALVAEHRRALVVQRTGWGKSAVYFVATALLRAQGAGPTVIISPLLALMRDQIAAASRAGVRAVTINSANVTEWDAIHAQIASGEVDVLLCSPERLNNPDFRDDVLPQLAASAGLVVIDEAHCISDWGHDFRPDYRRIRTLIADLPTGIPVLATTATANERVTLDVAEQLAVTHAAGSRPAGSGPALMDTLGTRGTQGGAAGVPGTPESVLVLRGALDRESLHLAVLPVTDQPTRIAWLIEALKTFDGSGIVYCLTVAAAEQVAEQLRTHGLAVQAYTGRTDPAEREGLEADLKENRVKALIATSALGMGFDKPDLAFVIHLGAPSSPIAYYQQVGRAGRGVDKATVVLVPGEEDQRIWDYFGSLGFPAEEQVRTVLGALEAGGTQSVARLETQVDLRRSRLEMMLKVLDVDDVVRRVKGGWESTGRPWVYEADRYARVAQARVHEQQTMLEYERTSGCRMAFLRATLDDPELSPGWVCGRCDRCAHVALPPLPDAAAISVARAEMDRPGIEVSPRRMWPSGMSNLGIDLAGRIPPAEQSEQGRAIARLDGLGWSGPLRDLFDPKTPDGEVPVALRTAAARVLDSWDRTASIDGIVWIASATRPQLVEHLATGLGRYLKKPVAGAVRPRPDMAPGRHDINSAMRLASVSQRLELDLSPAAAAGLPGRTILLIDDLTDSGWTLTVAARLLRLAGAQAVLPFVLAVQ